MKATLWLTGIMVLTGASMAFAADLECKIKAVTAGTVVLDCGPKADKLKTGDQVKVKPGANKRREHINGC